LDIVKEHFENEANEYDQIIIRLIPFYSQMVGTLIAAIPHKTNDTFKAIDLGCGTGTISKNLVEHFPNIHITCLDIADNMLKLAQHKLADHKPSNFILGDFNDFEFDQSYDVIVSSLALHHLINKEDKIEFYIKICDALSQGGIFINADVVLAANDSLQELYIQKWKTFMRKHVSNEEIENTWLPTYYREDHPAPLLEQCSWLTDIGFTDVDILWKYYNFAVYSGRKAE
jgi:tRNA (cmo5U34)-methyltransferase